LSHKKTSKHIWDYSLGGITMSPLNLSRRARLLAVLGLDPKCNYTHDGPELHKAYLAASLKVHPDKNPDDKNATAKFQNLTKAYEALVAETEQWQEENATTTSPVDTSAVPETTTEEPAKKPRHQRKMEERKRRQEEILVARATFKAREKNRREIWRKLIASDGYNYNSTELRRLCPITINPITCMEEQPKDIEYVKAFEKAVAGDTAKYHDEQYQDEQHWERNADQDLVEQFPETEEERDMAAKTTEFWAKKKAAAGTSNASQWMTLVQRSKLTSTQSRDHLPKLKRIPRRVQIPS
jgi:hypothetical protein